MDKDLLARKLYAERIHSLMGDQELDEAQIEQLWESKASPAEAAKTLQDNQGFEGPAWLERYLHRNR
ncbi:hypothetical protein [Vibrio sp. SCSIO 43136]|uniref:hypothetical protein n=1 Tax=Vibrio sp. SCSIO 43136 TaxID=2819101 RepID=UPI002075B72F|nr:hypothetical protein [Vibrio sp. SCSIO 43136]USD64526.1 hypothetical protein J4N39_10485 [Vibrio sp. SCSIO 43136]